MNKELAEIVKLYAISPHKELRSALGEKSKDNLMAILLDLMTLYFNDRNSSTLRQFILVVMSGYEMNLDKIGYNGYRQTSIGGSQEFCEAKPKNINSNDKKLKKLDGGGNFTDYTWNRLKKDKTENPTMLVGGFIDGKLVYIFEFKFKMKSFVDKLTRQLKKHFPHGYESGRFLRSASFGFKDFVHSRQLKHRIFVDEKYLLKNKGFFTRDLFNFLHKSIKNNERKKLSK